MELRVGFKDPKEEGGPDGTKLGLTDEGVWLGVSEGIPLLGDKEGAFDGSVVGDPDGTELGTSVEGV